MFELDVLFEIVCARAMGVNAPASAAGDQQKGADLRDGMALTRLALSRSNSM